MVKAKKLKWRERKAARQGAKIPSMPVARAVELAPWVKADLSLQLWSMGQQRHTGRWGGFAKRSPLWPHHLPQGKY